MCPAYADVESGSMLDTLYPLAFYHDSDDGLYIEFQTGAMPGCSKGRGGHLSRNNPNYKELYSLLLTMMATKNFKGAVRFEKTALRVGGNAQSKVFLLNPTRFLHHGVMNPHYKGSYFQAYRLD